MKDRNATFKRKTGMERFGSSEGGSLASGLAMRERGDVTPESLGMGNKGFSSNQVPLGPAKHKAKGPFTFC